MEQQHRARWEKNKARLMVRERAEKNQGPSQLNQNCQTPSNWTQPVLILLMNGDKLQPHERKRVNGDDRLPEAPEICFFKQQIEELLSFMK